MNGGGHAEDKIRNSHGLYGKVLGRRDAAPLPAVSSFLVVLQMAFGGESLT